MIKTLFKTLLALSLSLSALSAFALTDEEALAEGMTPIENFLSQKLQSPEDIFINFKSNVSGGPTLSDVQEAIRSHRLVIAVNKSAKGAEAQTLVMYENGVEILREKISTGREKQEKSVSGRVYFSTTPKGFYRPQRIYQDYLSYTWNAPMPNAVFIVGGIALHATGKSHYAELGTRASGGCVRLKLEISQLIREKVMETGLGSGKGQYKVVKEAHGRNRILNNSVMVDQIDRNNGSIQNAKIDSWDTVVIVYEK